MRPLVALASLALSLAALAALPSPAAASCSTTGSPHTRVDGVSVETRDGSPWKSGEPVSIVVRMSRVDDDWAFPENGLAVVMRTDSERTKCLDVPLRQIGGSRDQAIYAGVFYPFREASYEAKLTIGGEAHDIAFTVGTPAVDAPPALGVAEVGRAGTTADLAGAGTTAAAGSFFAAGSSALVAAAILALATIALARRRRGTSSLAA